MVNRIVPVVLLVVLGVLHAQLWLGRGSVPAVKQMRQKIVAQEAANARSLAVNERLASEVGDLKEGLDMVEEKARYELGMVRPNEILVQYTR
ncbi:septum formation initiator family protein [uncultured Xylophilus sp.]|uniref:septum formation initiator family protein n=1 Tax=uncultured Xylophilus sp. TaxID=296832 RepID=UPI0025FBE7FA|nr:septum formation initiator family protein [uncultured Xylophilus sp.]